MTNESSIHDNKHTAAGERLHKISLLLIPLAFLLYAGNGFPYLDGGTYSDFAISHYPNALYLQRSLWHAHTFPWWSPLILSGAPFAADPLSSAWYPLHYLGLLFPLPFGLHLTAALHLWIGGLGMYFLLRAEKLEAKTALWGALAFQLLPKAWAHYGAGHLTLWYALAWTPWAAWIPTSRTSRKNRAWLTALGGFPAVLLAFLADPRWGPFVGLLFVAQGIRLMRKEKSWLPPGNRKSLALSLALLVLALPYAWHLWQFARLSTRAALTLSEALTFSISPLDLVGMLLPTAASAESVLYVGAAVLALLVLALVWPQVQKRTRFWQGIAFFSLAFALGPNLPFFAPLILRLPGFNLLRVPARALFLFGMALIVLAAHALESALKEEAPKSTTRSASLGLTALAGTVWALTIGLGVLNNQWETGLLWVALLWVGTLFGVLLSLRKRYPSRVAFVLLLGLTVLDGGGFAFQHLIFLPKNVILSENAGAVTYLVGQEGRFRVYSPSYSIPQQSAAFYGLELADGVNPLQIAGYAQFMQAATGVPAHGYSVTLPPFASGDPSQDNVAYTPDACRLGLLNVRFVAAEFDLHAPALVEVARFGKTRLYRNQCALGPAWVQAPLDPPGTQAQPLPDEAVQWQPNRITVQANGPGLLVLSEVAYPGWQVSVDGQPAEMRTLAGVLRAVLLPAGAHEAVFTYHPWHIK